MHNLDYSIIIVNYNTKELTKQCLTSILHHHNRNNYEIFLVDNGSTDGSIDHLSKLFPNLFIIENKTNFGFAKANNVALKLISTEYVCLVNSDIIFRENCLDILIDTLKRNSNISLIAPKILNDDFSIQKSCKNIPNLWDMFCREYSLDKLFTNSKIFSNYLMHYWNHDSFQEVELVSGCLFATRSILIKELNYFDERFFMYSEDKDLCVRIISSGGSIFFTPHTSAIHLGGGSEDFTSDTGNLIYYQSNILFWKKYHSGPSVLFFKAILLSSLTIKYIIKTILNLLKKQPNGSNTKLYYSISKSILHT